MSKITCTFKSRSDLEGLRDILVIVQDCNLSIFHGIIRRRLLKSVEKRLKGK